MATCGRRVLIPKGTLSPGKNNVIEIPQSSSSKIIVATKPKGGDSECAAKRSTRSPQQASMSARQRIPPAKPGSSSRRSHGLNVSGSHSVTTVGPDIAELERQEMRNFKEDLKGFQDARKKLFADVISLQMTKVRKP